MNQLFARILLLLASTLPGYFAAGEEPPSLVFEKCIGDMRGLSRDNVSVTVTKQGRIALLMASGRVAIFNPDGTYRHSLQMDLSRLDWHHRFRYLAADGETLMAGTSEEDAPWVYAPARCGNSPNQFQQPSQTIRAEDGRVFVADSGNKRIAVYLPNQFDEPQQLISVSFPPIFLAVKGELLAVGDGNSFTIYTLKENQTTLLNHTSLPKLRGLALFDLNEPAVLAITEDALLKYSINAEKSAKPSVLSPSYRTRWPQMFPSEVAMTVGNDGCVYFSAEDEGRLLALNPADDSIREVGVLPKKTKAIAQGADGVWFSGRNSGHRGDARIWAHPNNNGQLGEVTAYGGVLYDEPNVPVWSILPDSGGILVRVLETGYQKGWPAFNILRVMPDGSVQPFHDFGHLYGHRATFSPWELTYSIKHDNNQAVLLCSPGLLAVCKMDSAGGLIWEAGSEGRGGADSIELRAPRDVACDSQGRVWVCDNKSDQLICLDAHGRLLLRYGRTAGIDEQDGAGFFHPTGIAVTRGNGHEFLYVGDAGNQRIIKFHLD